MTAALIPATALPDRTTLPSRTEHAARPLSPEVYRRRRLVAAAVVIGLLLGLASFGRQAEATRTADAQAAETVTVVVQPGDTLWSIADTLVDDADLRPLVSELSDLAGGASIQPGQLLQIPGDLID
jgi:hypothetical protein